MQPILHLSLPVRDMDEALAFYVRVLGCEAARSRVGFSDVWFHGMQVTLQDRPDEVTPLAEGGCRHFGVTLGRDEFDALVARLESHHVTWLVPVSTDDAGLATEQTKAKFADPSGNVIEVKTYRDVAAALEISPHSYPEELAHGN
jgi:extradiol dioxygenase family protein